MIKNRSLSGRRPFSSVWQAAALLDCPERQVYHYVQEGRIPLAFNLSRPGGRRCFLRMATASVVALQRHQRPARELEAFLAEALPESQYSYKAPHLARLFQCDLDHIYRLIEGKALEDVGGSVHYWVPRQSVAAFLTARRVQ